MFIADRSAEAAIAPAWFRPGAVRLSKVHQTRYCHGTLDPAANGGGRGPLPNFRLRIGDDVCLQPDHAKNAPVRCPDGARRLLMLEFPILLVGLIFYIVLSHF